MVECFLAKEDVAGSTPVSRSKEILPAIHFSYNSAGQKSISPPEARYPSGKGEVCKTFMRRFDSDPRLQSVYRFDSAGRRSSRGLPKIDYAGWELEVKSRGGATV